MTVANPESLVRLHTAHTMFVRCESMAVTLGPAGETTFVSTMDNNIELPVGSPISEPVIDAVRAGATLSLVREGRRVLNLVAADIADSRRGAAAEEPPAEDVERRIKLMCEEQGVGPVTDPSTLLGEPFDGFDDFFAAATEGRR